MLVLPPADGHGGTAGSVGADFLGSISGGCLEDDARANVPWKPSPPAAPPSCATTTTAEGDILFGTGLGCQGVVHILIQPLNVVLRRDQSRRTASVSRSTLAFVPGVLATVIGTDRTLRQPVSARGWAMPSGWPQPDESAGSEHTFHRERRPWPTPMDGRRTRRPARRGGPRLA